MNWRPPAPDGGVCRAECNSVRVVHLLVSALSREDRPVPAPIGSIMKRLLASAAFLVLLGIGAPVVAAELLPAAAAVGPMQTEYPCYGCIRDGIYADIGLIDRLEADPAIDDGVRAPQIAAARADIQRLRGWLGPVVQHGTEPCCYSRRPLYIR